jgi:hypothetical protein
MFKNIKPWKPEREREREMFYNTKNTGLPLGAFGNI